MIPKTIYFGQIQDYIEEHYEKNKELIPFFEAFKALSKHPGDINYGSVSSPNFLTWNWNDDFQFIDLCRKIPVYSALVQEPAIKPEISTTDIYLPMTRNVFISKEIYGAQSGTHIDDCYTLIYVLKGTCHLTLENRSFDMHIGEICAIAPRVIRGHKIDKDSIVISIMIHKEIFKKSFAELLKADAPLTAFFRQTLFHSSKEYLFFMLPPTLEIRQIIGQLFQEFVHYDTYSDYISTHCLNILFAKIIRNTTITYNYYNNRHTYPSSISVPYILKYMEEHFLNLTLEDLASHLNYDRSYLSKLIHKYTGKTYTEIITGYRHEKALYYLDYSNKKINEIAELTGYNSTDHFTRSFKKTVGCSPREYRKRSAN